MINKLIKVYSYSREETGWDLRLVNVGFAGM